MNENRFNTIRFPAQIPLVFPLTRYIRTNRLSQSPSIKVLLWALFYKTESEILADLGSFKVHEFTVIISILSSIWFRSGFLPKYLSGPPRLARPPRPGRLPRFWVSIRSYKKQPVKLPSYPFINLVLAGRVDFPSYPFIKAYPFIREVRGHCFVSKNLSLLKS